MSAAGPFPRHSLPLGVGGVQRQAGRMNVRVDRLDLDLRGIDPQVAEAAVRLLAPALRAALARGAGPAGAPGGARADLDAGRAAPAADAPALAQRLAERIAGAIAPRQEG